MLRFHRESLVDVELVPLPLLADPASYAACTWDLLQHDPLRAYWLANFRKHFGKLLAEAGKALEQRGESQAVAARRTEHARRLFEGLLDGLVREPGLIGPLDILTICHARELALRQADIGDAYEFAKGRENRAALALLPALLRDLDRVEDPDQRLQSLIEGVFAGNIYDLGATEVMDTILKDGVDFHAVRGRLKRRPWLVDGLDALRARLAARPARCALLFVDNAGCDVALGMIPLARELLALGARVILTANTAPSLNDITHAELLAMLGAIDAWDAPLRAARAEGRLRVIASGNAYPLIDLSRIARPLAEAVAEEGVDLVVLEGMGRGVESNWNARLGVDVVKIAMLKDRGVAEALGGTMYDLVMKWG